MPGSSKSELQNGNPAPGASGQPALQRGSYSFSGIQAALGSGRGGQPDGHSTRAESSGWSGIFGVGLFGTATGPRTVVARADSFTGPPRAAIPFNLENEDAESVETAFWSKGVFGWVYNWWRQGRRSVHGAARRGAGGHVVGGNFVFPIHAVRLGNTVTFLPTPLRNWWGRPKLLYAWLGLSIYLAIVMSVKLGFYYFLSTSLIIYPADICGAALGFAASIKYIRGRQAIGSFDAAEAVESTKLLSLLAVLLSMLALAGNIAVSLAWALRQVGCQDKSFSDCNAQDMCQDWSPCFATAPAWLTAKWDIILGSIELSASIPYIVTSIMVFRRARAASYYLVDNML